jgi:hypothetical protein
MCMGGCVAAAFLLAAAFCLSARSALAETEQSELDNSIIAAQMLPAASARAQAQGDPAPPHAVSSADEQARFLLFSGSDFWREGGFAHAGVLWAQNGLDREGLVVKLMFGGGIYHYVSGALGNADVRGQEYAGSILPGWRFVRDRLTVTVFLGADFQHHTLTPDDPTASLRGGYAGVRTGFELWYEPTAGTMLAADASVSSIGPGYNARLAAGWRVLDAFYIGPEVQGFADGDNYRQVRAGIHLTGIRTGDFEWSAGLGFAEDTDHRSGAYGKLSVFTRR